MNRVTFSVVAIMLLAAATTLPFVLNAGFGKAPQGAQLSQVEASPHYRDGQFHNQLPTPGFTGQKNMLAAWWDFLMTKRENARPAQPLPLVKTDLAIMENGQYDQDWKYIHMMPDETAQAADDLRARAVLPGHAGRFVLAKHSWDEPYQRLAAASEGRAWRLLTPVQGEPVWVADKTQSFNAWWR